MILLGSTTLNSSPSTMTAASARFIFEPRAATVLFNILNACPESGPFLLPANICPIVPMVLYKAKRSFEFIDISPKTLCMDDDAIIQRWMKPDKRPAGIIYVRSYGAIFDTTAIFAKIKSLSPRALIIDDRCLCPPDFSCSLSPNTDALLYSTGYAKYADLDFGGFGVLDVNLPYISSKLPFCAVDLEELVISYKQSLLERKRFSYKESDWLDTTTPNISWEHYRSLAEQECRRVSRMKYLMNSIYTARVAQEAQIPEVFQSWRFNILVNNSIDVLEAIKGEGLFASSHYESLAGLFGPGRAPNAEKIHRHIINLFNDRYFDVGKAIRMTDLLGRLKISHSGCLFK